MHLLYHTLHGQDHQLHERAAIVSWARGAEYHIGMVPF